MSGREFAIIGSIRLSVCFYRFNTWKVSNGASAFYAIFVGVAEEQHFGRAAARLHVAQPALSRQIQDLEREMGFLLFDDCPRRPIERAGNVFLSDARRILQDVDEAKRRAERIALGNAGTLRVGIAWRYRGMGWLWTRFANSGVGNQTWSWWCSICSLSIRLTPSYRPTGCWVRGHDHTVAQRLGASAVRAGTIAVSSAQGASLNKTEKNSAAGPAEHAVRRVPALGQSSFL